MKTSAIGLAALTLCACTAPAAQKTAPAAAAPVAAAPALAEPASASSDPRAPAAAAATGERTFGAPAVSATPVTPVAAVMADPEPWLGKNVRCEGIVSRVCQRAGCWLELSADGKAEGLRVPMANHAFFIPQDAVGQRAIVEGEVAALPLRPEQRAHLEGEGLKAIGPLSLAATSVTLRPR